MINDDFERDLEMPTYGDGRAWKPPSPHSLKNRIGRAIWDVVWLFLFRPSPRFMMGWRRWLLRSFGARIGSGAVVYPSVRVWAPWNLRMGKSATLSWGVECYCVALIILEDYAIVSQYSQLCTASHNFEHPRRPVVTSPITIGTKAWVCADVFIGPGVKIGEGTVVGARTSVFKDLPAWSVVTGSPDLRIRKRKLKNCTRP